jgi:tetratricopeptide (TPR) repeat protein
LLGDAASAQSSDRDRVLELRVNQLVSEGRCVEALPEIEEARRRNPNDAPMALVEGQCRIRGFDYAGAAPALQDANRLDPGLRDASLYLGIALYHLEDFDGAETALANAQGNYSVSSAPQFDLYSGLIYLHRDEPRKAALALESARTAAPEQVEPVASFYAGLAWQGVNERELARDAFERVIDIDGDGPWAQRARLALGSQELQDRAWISGRLGIEYDSNVVLLGDFDGLIAPQQITDQSDGRGVWFLDGGVELFHTDNWSGGVVGSYAGSVHFNLHEYDTHYPTVGAWVDRAIGSKSLVRARYDIGHAWVDYASFVTTQTALLSGQHNWGEPGQTELGLGWEWNDYHFFIPFELPGNGVTGSPCPVTRPDLAPCSPPNVNTLLARDRDGNGLRVGGLHRYEIRAIEGDVLQRAMLRGGYAYRRYWAKGTDWDFQSHTFELGLDLALPWKVDADLWGSYAYTPFDNPSSYPPPLTFADRQYFLSPQARTDNVWRVNTVISRPINDLVRVSARYYFTRNVSNVAVFDYDRHVVGAHVEMRF